MRRFIDAPILHPQPSPSVNHSLAVLDKMCTCHDYCHERPGTLWYSDLNTYLPLVKDALAYHISRDKKKKGSRRFLETTVRPEDLSTEPVGTVLPFLPDVVIQYRCSDNFIGTTLPSVLA